MSIKSNLLITMFNPTKNLEKKTTGKNLKKFAPVSFLISQEVPKPPSNYSDNNNDGIHEEL